MNQRTPANPTIVVARSPLVRAILGSQSYDYSINLVSLAGRNSTNVNLSLTYNSRVWSRTADGVMFNADIDNPSPGFRGVDFGFLQWSVSNSDWILTGPNGNKSELINVSGTALYQSQDSTYIQFSSSTNVVTYRDGTQVFYEQFGPAPFNSMSPLRPNKIENTNGNIISITYTNSTVLSLSTITDALGRTINFSYDPTGHLTKITQGARTITFSWNTSYVLKYQFSTAVIASPANGSTQSVLSSVTFADNTTVNFLYGDWGIVNRIERRSTSGALRAYVSYNFPASAAGASADAPAFTQQTVFDGVNTSLWNYSVTTNASGMVTSSAVTDPLGTTTTTTFSSAGDWKDGMPIIEQVKDVNGRVWRTRTKTWTSDTGTSAVNPRIALVVTQLDDGTQSNVSYSYDANGNVTDLQETDFAAGAPGPLLRETVTAYASLGNHILNRPSQILIKDANGIVSRTDLAYDEYSSYPLQTVTPAAVQHDDSNYSSTPTNARGNLTTKTVYTNAALGSGPIKSIFKYDVLGNRVSAQTGCCTQASSTYSVTTQYAYPDSVSTGPAGSQLTTSFTYNFNSGTVASATDVNGQVTTTSYDANNRITSTQTPDGIVNSRAYDDASASPGWTSSTTADSRQTVIVNDFNGHELTNKLYNGSTLVTTTSSSYDSLGRVTQTSNPYGPSDSAVFTIYSYDALGRIIQRTPPALTAGVTQSGFQIAHIGHTATFTDPTGGQRKEHYNALGQLVEVDEPGPGANAAGTPGSGSITISGSLHSSTTSGTRATGSFTITGGETGVRTWICNDTCVRGPFVWDSGTVSVIVNGVTYSASYGLNSTTSSIANSLAAQMTGSPVSGSSPGTGAASNLTADQPGPNYPLSASSSTNDPTDFGGASFGATLSGGALTGGVYPVTTYDSGTVTVTVNGFQASVSYSQNLNSTPTTLASALASALNVSASPVTAIASGTTINLTAKGVGTATNYSVSGGSSTSFTATSTTLAGGTNPAGIFAPYVTNYNYGALGNLLQVNQGQQIRSFGYDSLGRTTSMSIPEKVNHAVTMTYTDFGAVATRTDARGITTTYGYDNQGRPASMQYSDGTPTVTYAYGAMGAPNFTAGRLTTVTDGAGSEAYQYDSMGRETKCTRVLGTNTYVTTYSYTSDGRVASTTYPSGRVVTNQYDGIGRLTQVATGGASLLNINSYNAAGQILGLQYGNGVPASYTYNNQLQIASLLVGGANPALNLSYDWGGAGDDGLLLGVTDNLTSSRSTSYTYDQLKRLTAAQTVDLTSAGTWQLQFAYDRYGNRLSQTPTGGTAAMPSNSVVVDPTTNRISSATYDADGNVTNDGLNAYIFDAESRITHVNGAANTYAYDGAGKRVNRNGNYYIYSGGQVIAEYTNGAAAASPSTEYIYGRGKRIATIAAAAVTYPYWDHLSIRANASASGTVIRTFGHYPFGETWYETGTHDKWDYTTYENDSESGLNYAMARFHNPRVGRFMSLDPYPSDKRYPQSWNRYPYGNNNPVSFSDPTGMDGCDDETGDCGGDGFGGVDPNETSDQIDAGGNNIDGGAADEGASEDQNDNGDGCPEGHACLPDQPPQCVPSGDGDCVSVSLIPPESASAPPDVSTSSTTDPSEDGSSTQPGSNSDPQQTPPAGLLPGDNAPPEVPHPPDPSLNTCDILEIEGGVLGVTGGVTFMFGLGADATVVGAPEGLTANGVGGGLMALGGIFGGAGLVGNKLHICK